MDKTNKRSAETRAIVLKTARITGLSVRSIERVISGDQKNDVAFSTYMELLESGNEKENELKVALMELVPISTKKQG